MAHYKVLAVGQLANSKGTLYECPAGYSAIVKTMCLVNVAGAIRTVNLYVLRSGGTSRRILPVDASLAASGTDSRWLESVTYTLDAGDKIEGDASVATCVDYSLFGGEVAKSNTTPVAPSGLVATAVSGTQINLTWTDNSGNEDGFKIERSTDGGVTYSQLDTVAQNIVAYSDTSCSPVTEYYYRVRAYNIYADSSYSGAANATTVT